MRSSRFTFHVSRITHLDKQPTQSPARALVTGAGGFAGRHLLAYLQEATNWELYGNAHRPPSGSPGDLWALERVRWVTADLTVRAPTAEMVGQVRPDFVFHLAAQSNVPEAFR